MPEEIQELKYLAYCRKSVEENGPKEKILSIESQRKLLINLAKEKKLDIVNIFTENKTAFKPGRPVFNTMIRKIENGEANALLCWKLDRLSRNSLETGKLGWLIDEKKLLEIYTYDGNKYRNSSDNKFILDIQFALSKKSSGDTSENVKRDIQTKLESKKEWPSLAAPGYLNIKGNVISGKSYNPDKQRFLEELKRPLKRVELDPFVSPQIKKIFEYASTGLYSLDRLKEKADQLGLKGRRGKKMSRSNIAHVLQNPFYCGIMKFKGVEYAGSHDTLVDQTLFNLVQEKLKEKSKPITQHWNHDFKGIIKCASCGCFITAETKIKKNKTNDRVHYFTYYHCTRRKGPCNEPPIIEKDLERQFEEKIAETTISDLVKELLSEAIKEGLEEERKIHSRSIDHWQRILQKCDERSNRLLDALADGLISNEEYTLKRNEILEEKMQAKQFLDDRDKMNKSWHDYASNLVITSNKVYEIFKEGTSENKKAILMAIGQNFRLKDGIVTFDYKEPFNWVAELNKSKTKNYKGYNLSNVLPGLDSNQDT